MATTEEKIATLNSIEHAIGYFSVSSDGTFYNDTSALKTIRLPDRYPLDLLDGFTGGSPEYNDVQLQHLLMWMQEHKPCLDDVDFVCTRGLMCKMLNSHYDWRFDYMFFATVLNGTIYASEEQQNTHFYNEESNASFAGYRFEKYVSDDQSNGGENIGDLRSQYVVFKRTLGTWNFLYSAEVDGIWLNPATGRFELVEVKCRKISYENYGFEKNKTRSWFLQSFLTSVNTFVCGFRDDNFQLCDVTTIDSSVVLNAGSDFWIPDPCITRLKNNFKRLEKLVRDPNHIYELYKPTRSKRLVKTNKNDGSLLPPWYSQQ